MRLLSPQWAAVGAALVVVLGGGATAWMQWGGSSEDAAPQVRTEQPGVDDADAAAEALGKLTSDPGSLVAADVRSALGDQAGNAVPDGSTVTPNAASWSPDGIGGGTMTVTVGAPDQPPATYSAIMVKEPDGWKVVGTIPMNPANAGTTATTPGRAPAANAPGTGPAAANPAAGTAGTQQNVPAEGAREGKKAKKRDRRVGSDR